LPLAVRVFLFLPADDRPKCGFPLADHLRRNAVAHQEMEDLFGIDKKRVYGTVLVVVLSPLLDADPAPPEL
jgi:hypothetical protein